MPIINESGLYSLVLSSKLPGAKKFRRWVTSEVLPSIRKTGHYTAKPMTDYQMESIRVRKAQLLERLAKEYDGTYRQVLQAHATKELTGEYLLPLPISGKRPTQHRRSAKNWASPQTRSGCSPTATT